MINKAIHIILSGLLLLVACDVKKEKTRNMKIICIDLPDLPGADGQPFTGVSAPFTGIHKDMLIVAGGCNFPDAPPSEGGSKVFYNEIYVLNTQEETGWERSGQLPVPVAYGASVTTPEGVICIGGTDETNSFKEIYRLQWDEINKKIVQENLPVLPVSMDNMAAAYIDGQLYVAGGNVDGTPSSDLYVMNLQDKREWKQLTSFPGKSIVQPTLSAQYVEDKPFLWLSSGFQPVQEDEKAFVSTELYSYNIQTDSWAKVSDIPLSEDNLPQTFTGGSSVAFGKDALLFVGGVNYTVFERALNFRILMNEADKANRIEEVDKLMNEMQQYMRHSVEWYQFNLSLYQYNVVTGEWTLLDKNEAFARAGAGVVLQDTTLYILNGELKPGVRTPSVRKVTITEN